MRTYSLFTVFFLNSIVFFNTAWGAESIPTEMTYIGDFSGVKEYRLNNKLQILLKPDANASHLVVNVIYHHGRKNESYGLREINHVLEHYLVIQNQKMKTSRFPDFKFKCLGITGSDFTYYRSILSDSAGLTPILEMEKYRMGQFTESPQDLQQAVKEVEEELSKVHQDKWLEEIGLMEKDVFRNEAYAVNPIGETSDLKRITVQDLKNYWSANYHTDRATIVIAGKFDLQKSLPLIVENFSSLDQSPIVLGRFNYLKSPQYGEREFIVRKHNAKPVVWVAYKIPPVGSADYSIALMTGRLLAPQTDMSLWQKALLDKKKIESIDAYILPLAHGGIFMLRVRLSREDQVAGFKKFLEQQEKKLSHNVTDVVINTQKENVLRGFIEVDGNPQQFAENIAQHVAVGDWQSYYHLRTQIQSMTAAQYKEGLNRWFVPTNRTIGIFIDPRDSDSPTYQ